MPGGQSGQAIMEKTNITTEELKTLLVANNFDAAATAGAISKVMPLEVADIEKAIGDNLAWFTCDLDEGEPIELDEEKFLAQLQHLKDYVVEEPDDIRAYIQDIVPTYSVQNR